MAAELQCYLERYKKVCEESSLGHNGICHDNKLKEQIRQWLIKSGAHLASLLWVDVHEIIAKSLQRSHNNPNIFKKLIGAFELLEMAAANLFQYPWRNEFKTIKTFSGAYVYHLKPTICNEDLERIFKRMGYRVKDNLELEVGDLPHASQLISLAFNFFVARTECEILLEVIGKLGYCKVSVEELLLQRKLMTNIDACVERLNRTCSTSETQRGKQLQRTLASVSNAEDIYMDSGSNPSANHQTDSPSQQEYNRSTIPLAMHVEYRPYSSDQYKDETCNKHITRISGNEHIPPSNIEDNKFEESQDLHKTTAEFKSVGEPDTAGDVLDLKKYLKHNCLDSGESVRYCCDTCCTAHTISCNSMKTCMDHVLRFFEAADSVCLQQAEGACSNLAQSSNAGILKVDPACVVCKALATYICCECGMCKCTYCGYQSILVCQKCDKMLEKLRS
ncbi:spermatogenesis associated 2-like [Mobula hypostoma]|uniref:spermatogenesis associated 2-like n=1 Tax=Mobula hypostoma TaxID=723540 RepID=UPI002FC32E8E